MPKRILGFSLAIFAVTLAACGGSGSGVVAPTATPTLSPTPVPTASAAVVTVNVSASPTAGVQVAMSTPDANGRPGTPIATQTTDPTGVTTFSNLTPTQSYCFVATYVPGAPGLNQTKSNCSPYWGYGITFNF